MATTMMMVFQVLSGALVAALVAASRRMNRGLIVNDCFNCFVCFNEERVFLLCGDNIFLKEEL